MSEKTNKPYKNSLKKALIENLKNGENITRACKNVGISRVTFYEWLKQSKEFKIDVETAQDSRIKLVEDILYIEALKGNITAIIFFLGNRAKDRWESINKIEHSGSIKETVTHLFKDLSDKELDKRIKKKEDKK